MKYVDVPRYKIRPNPGRFLLNKLFALILLGGLLYLAIYVNYYLLNRLIPSLINWIFGIVIVLLIVLELLLCYMKYGNYVYMFYDTKIVMNDGKERTVSYSNIKSMSYVSNFFDKRFRTGSILLELKDGSRLKLRYLESPNQAYFLIQKSMGFGR